MPHIARVTGIALKTLRTRVVDRGWSVARAVVEPVAKCYSDSPPLVFFVYEHHLTLSQLCFLHSIRIGTVRERLRQGWGIQKAIETASLKPRLYITYYGVTMPLCWWSRLLEVPEARLRKRKKAGYSDEHTIEEIDSVYTESTVTKELHRQFIKDWKEKIDRERHHRSDRERSADVEDQAAQAAQEDGRRQDEDRLRGDDQGQAAPDRE